MKKKYLKKLADLSLEELLQLRIYLDAVMRDFNVCPADQYTDAPAAAPPGADDHNHE